MLLCFIGDDDEKLRDYLNSLKSNTENSKVGVLFSRVEWKMFCQQNELGSNGRFPNLYVLLIDFSIPNFFPKFWFWFMFKRGAKKFGYLGSFKCVSYKYALLSVMSEDALLGVMG
jgi:hypothetical protein